MIDSPHLDICDVARCLVTGMQRLMCDSQHKPVSCGQDVWSGTRPGETECARYSWWAYFREPGPGEEYGAWERCEPDHPDAVPDLNRLMTEAVWNPVAGGWLRLS